VLARLRRCGHEAGSTKQVQGLLVAAMMSDALLLATQLSSFGRPYNRRGDQCGRALSERISGQRNQTAPKVKVTDRMYVMIDKTTASAA
jgi:hypothetical protein